MKKTIITLILIGLAGSAFSKTGEGVIMGRIFDRQSGKGLPGAYVVLKNNQGVMADDSGHYRLNVQPGNLNITFQFTGYKKKVVSVRVIEGETMKLDAGLETEISEIDQIVVTAGRTEQRISELAVSLTMIKPEIITKSHITDAMELINKTSGIEVLDGQASVRGGSGFSYGAGSRVLALIDGLPVIAPDAGNVKWQFLPLDQVSQVEIIKGASSVTYGSSALNGIINFRTADASNVPITKFYVESLLYGEPANKNWKWWNSPRFNKGAAFSHLQKWGRTDIGLGANWYDEEGYRKLNYEQIGKINFKLKHRDGNIEGLSYGMAIHAGVVKKIDFVQWENGEYGALKQSPSTAIELHGNFLALDPFVSFTKRELYKHDFRARYQNSKNDFPESPKNNSHARNIYAEYQFTWKITNWVSVVTGATQNFSWVNSEFHGNHHGLNVGAFAQSEMTLAKSLKLVTGLRAEYNTLDDTRDKLVPLLRTGLNFKAAGYTFLRASFGQGYRYPSIAEKHAATTLGTVKIIPNPFVKSESGWNSEIGIKQGIKTSCIQGQIDLAAFYSRYRNMIEYLFGIYPDPVDGSFSYGFKADNREASRVYGFELEYLLTGNSGWLTHTIQGGYTYMYPVEVNPNTHRETGVMLKYRRKHAFVLNLTNSVKKLDLGVSLFVKSKILNIDDVFVNEASRETILPGFYNYWIHNNKGYFVVDASAAYPLGNKLRISFVIKNLTNTEYMGRPGDIQPPRNFSLRLSGQF